MAATMLVGFFASIGALLAAVALAIALSWRRPDYRSPIMSDADLWKLSVVRSAIGLWPFMCLPFGLATRSLLQIRPRGLAFWSPFLWSVAAIVLVLGVSALLDRVKQWQDEQLSGKLQKELEPRLLECLGGVEGVLQNTRVRVYAIRTPNGVHGSIVLGVPCTATHPTRDVARIASSVVPPNLKLHVERLCQ